MRSVLKAFPTERLTLYKKDNSRAQITAVVDWLKENMGIDTSREPLDEIKGFEEGV